MRLGGALKTLGACERMSFDEFGGGGGGGGIFGGNGGRILGGIRTSENVFY